ncbi:MAG TPA: biotin--[acetyl-CoA-carboxylase] ligase [Vicinamibacterales bacterium]|nr:biotin--[acetyl-CoA-carboxylase] ligase [Vicinamibacterales bacterium]
MNRPKRIGREILHEAEVASTNDIAAAHAARGAAEGLVIVADAQTAGRGRQGRTWYSPQGSGLYVSVLLRPGTAARLLTLVGGLALCEALRESTGLPVEIKWPNDLLAPGGRRKLAGILVEGSAVGRHVEHVVFGYGVNVRAMAYPPEIRDRATSLEEELGRPVDRDSVLEHTLAALDRRYDDLLEGRAASILTRWLELSPTARGARVRWRSPAGERAGVTDGVDDTGALVIRTDLGVERVISGEVDLCSWP